MVRPGTNTLIISLFAAAALHCTSGVETPGPAPDTQTPDHGPEAIHFAEHLAVSEPFAFPNRVAVIVAVAVSVDEPELFALALANAHIVFGWRIL